MQSSERDHFAQSSRAEDCVERIRKLNDRFRKTMSGGQVFITSGVQELGLITATEILDRVRLFDDFSVDNDPYGEHDLGSFEWQSHRIFWKIDYYDNDLTYGSPDPSDPAVTTRVMTVMLASEY